MEAQKVNEDVESYPPYILMGKDLATCFNCFLFTGSSQHLGNFKLLYIVVYDELVSWVIF